MGRDNLKLELCRVAENGANFVHLFDELFVISSNKKAFAKKSGSRHCPTQATSTDRFAGAFSF